MSKIIKLLLVMLLAVLGFSIVGISSASAHDAPPHGSATCTDTTEWKVTNGTAVVQDAGTSKTTVALSSNHGTLSQNPSATFMNNGDGSSYTYTVTGIPLSNSSITVTSLTTWYKQDPNSKTPKLIVDGTDTHTVTINKPESNCTGAIPIPASPVPTPPTCAASGIATIPANTDAVHWSLSGNVATATAQGNNTFVGGSKTAVFTETVLPQLSGISCTERVQVPTLTVVGPTCSSAGSLVIPANTASVKWLVDGSQVNSGAGGTLGAGTYAISAHTTADYLFVGDLTHVNFSEVVPASLISQQICAPADLVTHVTHQNNDEPTCANPVINNVITVTTTTIHFVFDSETQTWIQGPPFITHMTTDQFDYFDGDVTTCYTVVTAVEPVITQPDCTHPNGSVVIPVAEDGVVYVVDTIPGPDGTYTLNPGAHTVEADALPGFKFEGDVYSKQWNYTINAAPSVASCTVVVTTPPAPPVKVVPVATVQPPLAFTGNPTGLEILIGSLLFGGGVLLLLLTRGRKSPGRQY